MVRHGAIYFAVFANSLQRKFLLIHSVLFENIKLLAQIIFLFTPSE